MAKAKKLPLIKTPRVQLYRPLGLKLKSNDTALFVQRMKELDREFARQTKQLASMTKDLAKKLTQKRSL